MNVVVMVMLIFGAVHAQGKSASEKTMGKKPIAQAQEIQKVQRVDEKKVEEKKLEEARVEAMKAEQAPPLDSNPVAPPPSASRPMKNWEVRASVGIDIQVSDNELNPRGTYNEPEEEAKMGGTAGVYIRRRLSERFGFTTGGEFVSRQMEQDYDWGWFIDDGGSTRYDVVSFEIPLYAEIYLGSRGVHTLYFGPKVATPVYDHCQNAIKDAALGMPCMSDAVRTVFVPVQVGYHLWISSAFGFTFFVESTATPIIDKNDLEVRSTRTGALATFYF